MGISIHLAISKSVTKDEWAAVYNETHQLVKAFPFAERREVSVRGVKTMCLVPTKEREERYGWNMEKLRIGWFADGDYESLCTAEEYFLPRDLVSEESYDAGAPDAMFGAFPAYLDYGWDDPRCRRCYELWGAKTQGEPYHMYLLAVACLIEDRLGSKAFVYGDITKGQCRKAVEMANRHLDNKIDVPDRCDSIRLLQRIQTFRLSEQEMLKLYTCFNLGNQDATFGETAHKYFSDDVFDDYWKKRFGRYQVTMRGFDDVLHDYLLWGFDLDKLAKYVSFVDKDGNEHYTDFVKSIMDAKLYLKEKDCDDILKIDQEEERPYGIATLFAQFVFRGARNTKIDRYIPIEDIREALSHSVGEHCKVDQIIDECLKEDEEYLQIEGVNRGELSKEDYEKAISHDASAVFTQEMEFQRKALEERREQYDVSDAEDLPYYEEGDTIHPDIAEQVGKCFAFYRNAVREERFGELMNASPKERFEWLVYQNRSILLRDKDWDKIFGDISENQDSFERYYPMVRVKVTSDPLIYLIRAIVINDDFYRYAFVLEEKYAKD